MGQGRIFARGMFSVEFFQNKSHAGNNPARIKQISGQGAMIVRDAIPLKQQIVFVAALVIALAVANVLAHLANGFNPHRTDEVHYTAGLETMPVVLVAMRALNFVSLGHIERGDQRGHLVLTGRLSRDKEKTASIIDFVLSLSAAVCAVVIARWVSRRVARDV